MAMIKVSDELWKYLTASKLGPRDTYEDVIWRFIRDESGEIEEVENAEA
jgi:hypothetical protein